MPDRTLPSETSGAFYFGCARGVSGHRDAGHYLYLPDGRGGVVSPPGGYQARALLDKTIPWGATPDATLAPREPGYRRGPELPQGVAALHPKDGWTALSFWDRSGDSRGNSNSTFIFNETLDFEEAVARAKSVFSALFDRFPFEVRPL